ncbi:MAG TPA: TolC family protein [Terriglobales bacterium]|nr:TolC family protein [Terriglobales bacterium]
MKFEFAAVLAFVLLVSTTPQTQAQEAVPATGTRKLSDILAEAERNNPQIQAARHEWDAAKQIPGQAGSLPDPQVVLQQFSVGSPRPFAGYTNSDFAYVGLGFSQDLPYPGKLRLRAQIAKKDAEVTEQRYESVRREVLSQVKQAYFQLGYLDKKASILDSDKDLLRQVEQSAEVHYRSGAGNQQEVLQAQLEETKLLREITVNQLEIGKKQAALKQLLDRSQSSPDIATTPLSETALPYTFEELLAAANANNPEIRSMQQMVQREKLEVNLAKKDFDPDFNVQYMWQRTDPTQFRAYYMLTFGIRLPIHRARLRDELAEAKAEESRAQSNYDAQSQQVASELRQQFITAQKSAELLKIDHDGLIPQARAELQAGFAAYQSNRLDFQALLNSFRDVLQLDEEYWQTLSEHETTVAQIEETTGLALR